MHTHAHNTHTARGWQSQNSTVFRRTFSSTSTDAATRSKLPDSPCDTTPCHSDAPHKGEPAAPDANMPQGRESQAWAGDSPLSLQEFFSSELHRNVFELFFGLVSSTVSTSERDTERQVHERVLKGLLHDVDAFVMSASGSVLTFASQRAVAQSLRNYLAGPNDPPVSAKVCVYVCVCVCEREREREREIVCVCARASERETERERERERERQTERQRE